MNMRGGKRPGAGRPKGTVYPPGQRRQSLTVRVPEWLFDWLKNHPESSGRLIERALIMTYGIKEPKK